MNRLFDIAKELGEIARKRFELRNELSFLERDIKTRETLLIPEGGWPGKNADERKAAETAAKAADVDLAQMLLDRTEIDIELARIDANREALIEERDAIRWTIRDREVAAVSNGDWSVLDLLNHQLADQSETPVEENQPAPEIYSSTADMDERARDDAAAAIRLAELDAIQDACQWDKNNVFEDEPKAARKRWAELMELQDAYEAKYNL